MPITQIQNTFTKGELDPRLIARVDFEDYYKGARKLRNTLVVPQGAVTQRFGTKLIGTVTDLSTGFVINDEQYIHFLVFTFSAERSYLIVVRPNGYDPNSFDPTTCPTAIDIWLDGTLVKTLVAADGVPWTADEIDNIRYVRATDRVLYLTPDTQPYQLVKALTALNTDWTITAQSFLYRPTFDYSSRDGGLAVYSGSTVTFTPSATSGNAVTITCANATPFTSNHVGGLYMGNSGVLRITAVNSTTVVTGFTVKDFANTNAIRGDRSLLREPTWGGGVGAVGVPLFRGWPQLGTLFQNRLVYARTDILPNFLSASASFDLNNFDDSEALDNLGFSYGVGSESLNRINHLVSSTSLVVITTNGLFSTGILGDKAITPANVFFNEQGREGSNEILAQVTDDQIFYVDNHGLSVKSVVFNIIQSSLETTEASILSNHLIREPREAAVYDNPFVSNGAYYYVVNGEDGSMAVFQTMKNQLVAAWTLQTTQGDFLDICADRDNAFVLVRRQVADDVGANQVVYRANPGFDLFTDITADCADTGSNVVLFDNVEWTNDFLVVGNSAPFLSVFFDLDLGADQSILPEFEYLRDDGRWVPLDNVLDNTFGLMVNGSMTWSFADVLYWSPQELNGVERKFWMRIKRTVAEDTLTVLPVESQVFCDRQEKILIEEIVFDHLMDCTYEASSDALGMIGGLTELAGQQVWCLRQTTNTYEVHAGIPHGPFFVDQFGGIDLGVEWASFDFDVGIEAKPLIVAMPPVAQFQNGSNVYLPRLIQSLFVDYHLSGGLIIAQREIPVLKVGSPSIDIPLTLQTGFWEISPFPDRDPRVEIPITTVQPLPFTIVGLGYKVDF